MEQETNPEFQNRKLGRHAYTNDSAITKTSKWLSKQLLLLSANITTRCGYWKASHIEVAAANTHWSYKKVSKLGVGVLGGECTLHPLFERSCQLLCFLGEGDQIQYTRHETDMKMVQQQIFKIANANKSLQVYYWARMKENHCEISFSGMRL